MRSMVRHGITCHQRSLPSNHPQADQHAEWTDQLGCELACTAYWNLLESAASLVEHLWNPIRTDKRGGQRRTSPGLEGREKTMEVLKVRGSSGRAIRGSLDSTMKRVTLSLASWIPRSKISIPYSSAARSLAMAATSLGTWVHMALT